MLIEEIQPAINNLKPAVRGWVVPAILILLCLPSLLFVWRNRDVPHFGILQDDGIYFIDGKALAQGSGYRILSLPDQSFDTRYPPLYPLYLSLVWRAKPAFPANLTPAILLSWLSLPIVLMLIYVWCRRQRFHTAILWLVPASFALNPYVLFFVSNLGSEILFMVFLLSAILLAERPALLAERPALRNWLYPMGAGLLAGAAYLTRTSGIALLPAAIVYYVWKKQAGASLWFALGMLPALAGWTLWSRLHAAPGHDLITLCYTNYFGYYFLNVGWDNIGHVLARNLSALLDAMGSLVFPQVMEAGLAAKLILWPLGAAMISGCVRMVRQGWGQLYALFGVSSAALLLIWHYQPNQRFILPLAPLLLASFGFEIAHWAHRLPRLIANRSRGLRVSAYGLAGYVVILLTAALVLQICMNIGVVPQLYRNDRANTQAYRSIYSWIANHLAADANILWQDDTALYLATGRHAASFVVPPRQFEATDKEAGEAGRYRHIDEYARKQHLNYILLAKIGLRHNAEVLRDAAANPALELIHEEAGGLLYRVREKAEFVKTAR